MKIVRVFRTAGTRWIGNRCATMSAALAFFAAFSLAPMLVVVIAVGGFFYGPDAVQGKIFAELQGLVGAQGATAVQAMLSSAWKADGTLIKTALSVLTILIGASATFAELRDDLDAVWGRQAGAPAAGIGATVKARLLAIGLVMGVGFLLVVSLVVDAGISAVEATVWRGDEATKVLAEVVHQASSFIFLSIAFAALLKFLPSIRIQWRQVWAGAIVAAAMFVIGRRLFGLYLAQAGTADAFGAAGSLAVILMWLFYSAAVFLFGAEFAHAWSGAADRTQPAPARAATSIAGADRSPTPPPA